MNLPLIILWAILRTCFVSTFMTLNLDLGMMQDGVNITHCIPESSLMLSHDIRFYLSAYLVGHAALSTLLNIIEGCQLFTPQSWPILHTISGRKSHLVQRSLYHINHLLLCIFILICSPVMFGQTDYFASGMLDYARILTPFFATWSILYFIQLVPSIGFFIISIYSMMRELYRMAVVYTIMVIPFVQTFYTFINSNSQQGCIKGFADVAESFYSLIMTMLNMINYTNYKIEKIELLYLTHILYTFVVSIMLINFFIAVMSDTMANNSRRRQMAKYIQQTSVSFALETNLRWLLKPYYSYMVKRLFLRSGEKVLIVDAATKIKEK